MKRKWIIFGIFAVLFIICFLNVNEAYSKKWVGVFIGDSITEQGYYIRALESEYPIKAENFGVSGAMYSSNGSGLACIYDEIVGGGWSGDEDFIFVLGGTNDWGNDIVLGTKSDTNSNTFYGGLFLAFSSLRERYPMKPIFVSTILQRDWPSANEYDQPSGIDSNRIGLSIEDYNEAIIWMAHRYGCIVLDAYGESGITMGTIRYYSDDGVHLNTVGGNQYADYIWGEIEKYLR